MKERELLTEKRVLEAEILERQEALRAVEILLNRIRKQSGADAALPSLTTPPPENQNGHKTRVRGVLKAAKLAADALASEFTRSQLFKKVEEMRPALVGKISAESQRTTMRLMVKEGWVFDENKVSPQTGEKIYKSVMFVSKTNGG